MTPNAPATFVADDSDFASLRPDLRFQLRELEASIRQQLVDLFSEDKFAAEHRIEILRIEVAVINLVAGLLGLSPVPAGMQMSCVTNRHPELPTVQTAMGTICLRSSETGKVAVVQRVVAAREGAAIVFEPNSPGLYQLTGIPPEVPSNWTINPVTPPWELAWQEQVLLSRRIPILVYVEDRDVDLRHPWQFDDFLARNYSVVEQSEGVTVYRLK